MTGPNDAVTGGGRGAGRAQAGDVLARLDFEPIGTVGEQFDPARHEVAEAVVEPGARPGTVVRVIRPGYGGGAILLRPAIVAVARAGSGQDSDGG